MARAKIVHQYEDGSATVMVVSTNADGPDALDECVRRVSELWRVACQDAEAETES